MLIVLFSAFSNTAAMEVVEKYCRVLLHVENHRQICPTGEQIPVCNIFLFLPFLSFFKKIFLIVNELKHCVVVMYNKTILCYSQ